VIAFADNAEMFDVEPAFGEFADGGFGSVVVAEYGDNCVVLRHGMLLLE
jgi:hypothetical protein